MNDFLIIGGGIAGLSVGARLSALGTVTILEAEEALGYHASGRSAALFDETYGHPTATALNRASRDYHATANGGILSDRGLMIVARTQDDAAFEHDIRVMKMDEIAPSEARDMIPILNPKTLSRAAFHADAWDMDTDLLMQNFAKQVRRNGGNILTTQRAERIERTAQGWRVHTKDQAHEARILVNAAGAWVDQIAQMAGITPLGFTPMRRSMARLPAPGGHDVGGWPMVLGAGETWYAKPDAGKLLVSPAEEDLQEPHDAWADDMVLAEGLARYEEMVTEPVTRLETSWAGLRTMSPDRVMVIGHDPHDPAFFWHAGQGGNGFQTSPAASQLAADLIAGRAPEVGTELATQLSPQRFAR
ncbi:NAD(P)/FAD-dependent oxidoreductase [Actibacterium lipolyticum]|uniref:Bifunctional tRNA (Mnm(5)s(2)U34)-methyltransferase/FAD-dependent cmnm(5)s(2)U34 oxidoreductase n=1 Tax=Actibacterium lipolyticum TaxID=1524263 RepID=A0A238JKT5_9RHOB|nr:FAD-binding oxidoreductase [Actibacterium lipolyticum]SMX31270.1 bifunctional tRNA (mnm(5)s(2)U34)-methyltransferase/FAD-dependent cmnm(5)s(2)U34 oxidoreductase [Actibacterium lipolyticum]